MVANFVSHDSQDRRCRRRSPPPVLLATSCERCHLDSDRHDRHLPRNRYLEQLASALGWPRDRSGDWLGPALLTGRDLHWADRDIPSVVLAAALPAG